MKTHDHWQMHDPVVREILYMQGSDDLRQALLKQYALATACIERACALALLIADVLARAPRRSNARRATTTGPY